MIGHPHREQWKAMGRRFKERFHHVARRDYDDVDYEEDNPELYPRPPNGTCRVQAIRSVSDWSHGVLTEHSIQNACEYHLPVSSCYRYRRLHGMLMHCVCRLPTYSRSEPFCLHRYMNPVAIRLLSLIQASHCRKPVLVS